jgi:osmoprotectant transport system substrate-binding protein
VPIVREQVLRDHPAVRDIVRELMQGLDTRTLQALNARMQIDGESAAEVAGDHLHERGLLRAATGTR